jgi:predicted CXXCH cytochrome family protein
VPEVCAECHDLIAGSFTRVHAPSGADTGRCTTCHDPHAAGKRLFRTAQVELCDRCHDRGSDGWRRIHAANGAAGVACAECHEAQHGT